MDAVSIELESGEIRTGTRDPSMGDVTLPGLEVVRSGLLIRLEGEPMRVTWSGHLSPEGPTLVWVAEPEKPRRLQTEHLQWVGFYLGHRCLIVRPLLHPPLNFCWPEHGLDVKVLTAVRAAARIPIPAVLFKKTSPRSV